MPRKNPEKTPEKPETREKPSVYCDCKEPVRGTLRDNSTGDQFAICLRCTREIN